MVVRFIDGEPISHLSNHTGGNEDLELRLKAHPPLPMPEPFCCIKAQPGRFVFNSYYMRFIFQALTLHNMLIYVVPN